MMRWRDKAKELDSGIRRNDVSTQRSCDVSEREGIRVWQIENRCAGEDDG